MFYLGLSSPLRKTVAGGMQSLTELQRQKTCYKLNIGQKKYIIVWGLCFELCNVIMSFQTNLEETKTENRMKTKIYYKQNKKTIKNDWTAKTLHLLIQNEKKHGKCIK